jgi:alpha-D-ribose 1-methylphosphonate 5-triphosphate synthase subunit PhnG
MAVFPEERSRGLAAAARVLRADLISAAETIAARNHVEVVEAPAPGSVMVELETPVGSFCLTEVVVTRCAVRVADNHGWAAVLGWDDEASLAAAIVDTQPEVADPLTTAALAAEAGARAAEAAAVAATKVEL